MLMLFRLRIRPKSIPEARFPARKHYLEGPGRPISTPPGPGPGPLLIGRGKGRRKALTLVTFRLGHDNYTW